jgi:hypothetical protein
VRARKLGVVLSLAAIACVAVASHAAYAIRTYVIGNAGRRPPGATGSGKKVYATAGQAAVGLSTGSGLEVCHGFWCWGSPVVLSVDPSPGQPDGSLPKALAFGSPRPNPTGDAARFAGRPATWRRTSICVSSTCRGEWCVSSIQVRVRRASIACRGMAATRRVARVSAGVYYARLTVEGVAIGTRRLVMRP